MDLFFLHVKTVNKNYHAIAAMYRHFRISRAPVISMTDWPGMDRN